MAVVSKTSSDILLIMDYEDESEMSRLVPVAERSGYSS